MPDEGLPRLSIDRAPHPSRRSLRSHRATSERASLVSPPTKGEGKKNDPRDLPIYRCRLRDQFDRRHHDLAAGDLSRFLRIVLEEIPRLQGFDGLLVGRRRKVRVIGVVAVLRQR